MKAPLCLEVDLLLPIATTTMITISSPIIIIQPIVSGLSNPRPLPQPVNMLYICPMMIMKINAAMPRSIQPIVFLDWSCTKRPKSISSTSRTVRPTPSRGAIWLRNAWKNPARIERSPRMIATIAWIPLLLPKIFI